MLHSGYLYYFYVFRCAFGAQTGIFNSASNFALTLKYKNKYFVIKRANWAEYFLFGVY